MSKFEKYLTESVSTTAIEYVTQSLFKGKSLKSACKAFLNKYGGQDATFIGKVDYSQEELEEAVLKDKAETAIKSAQKMKEGMGFMAIGGTAQRFNLDEKTLAKAVAKLTSGKNENGILKEYPELVKGNVTEEKINKPDPNKCIDNKPHWWERHGTGLSCKLCKKKKKSKI